MISQSQGTVGCTVDGIRKVNPSRTRDLDRLGLRHVMSLPSQLIQTPTWTLSDKSKRSTETIVSYLPATVYDATSLTMHLGGCAAVLG